MSNGSTWEELTLTRLDSAREHQRNAEKEAGRWSEVVKSLERALALDRRVRGIKGNGQYSFDPEKLRRQSIRESLTDIAAANNGLLVVSEATQILLDAEVGHDKSHIRNLIYSSLYHSKRCFKKERPGHYRLITRIEVPLSLLDK